MPPSGQGNSRSMQLAHPVAMMHSNGPQAVADYLDRMLAQRPNIAWAPGD